jgi:hypothetical protein
MPDAANKPAHAAHMSLSSRRSVLTNLEGLILHRQHIQTFLPVRDGHVNRAFSDLPRTEQGGKTSTSRLAPHLGGWPGLRTCICGGVRRIRNDKYCLQGLLPSLHAILVSCMPIEFGKSFLSRLNPACPPRSNLHNSTTANPSVLFESWELLLILCDHGIQTRRLQMLDRTLYDAPRVSTPSRTKVYRLRYPFLSQPTQISVFLQYPSRYSISYSTMH